MPDHLLAVAVGVFARSQSGSGTAAACVHARSSIGPHWMDADVSHNNGMNIVMKSATFASLAVAMLSVLTTAAIAQAEPAEAKASATAPSQAHVLSRAELDKLLAAPQSVLIVDVRRPDEVTKIGGFPVYLSVQLADLEKSLAWIPQDRTIVTVSNHAKRAQRAVDLLVSKGYRVAGAAGVQDYEAQGGALTKIAAPAPQAQTAAQVRPNTACH